MKCDSRDPSPMRPGVRRRGFIVAASALSLSVAGCGGGELAVLVPGVGTGGTGIVAGVITGLGSIIVDGLRYDDSQAQIEHLPDLVHGAPLAWSDLKLGQYVFLHLDALGTPMKVRLESQLVGPAAAVAAAAGRFVVMAQTVVVNSDPDAGPVTMFSGLGDLAELASGDPVQVYGLLAPDPSDPTRECIRATLVERIAREALPARVTGTVRRAGAQWLLAGMPVDASRLPATAGLADGLAVSLAVPWPAGAAPAPAHWAASGMQRLGAARFAADTMRLSGAVQPLPGDTAALVQGMRVDLADPALASVRGALAAGQYVTVRGRLDAGGGQVAASACDVVPRGGLAAELRGAVGAVAGSGLFVLRGQLVDATRAQWTGGAPGSAVPGRYVEVNGRVMGNVVVADRVNLPAALPEQAVLDVTGTVQAVDAATRTVHLVLGDGRVLAVAFGAMTGLPAPGERLRVAGVWHGGMLQPREMRRGM